MTPDAGGLATVKPLRVAMFDNSFRSYDASITHGATPPPSLVYVDFPRGAALDACDVLIATTDCARLAPPHPRRALWLQESREFRPHPAPRILAEFDLILTNDMVLVADYSGKAKWLTLIGTWLAARPAGAETPAKTRSVSMIASAKQQTSGHKLRHEVAAARLLPDADCYGTMFGKRVVTKEPALVPYRFTIVIEPASYATLVTEKLCDAFAARCVPLYWGPRNLMPLDALGFDISGILPWRTLDELRVLIATIAAPGYYEEFTAAVSTNAARARELYCTETLLEPLLREHFGL